VTIEERMPMPLVPISVAGGSEPSRVSVITASPKPASPWTLLLQDSFGYAVSKVVPGFVGLISVPILVRLIGIEEYGRLMIILPVLLALGGAGSGWLQQGILRFHPSENSHAGERATFERAVRLGTVFSVMALTLVLGLVLAGLDSNFWVWIIAEAYCALQLVYLIGLTRLQAKLQPRAVARNEVVRSSMGFLLAVALVLASGERSFTIVLLGLALGYALPLIFTNGWKNRPRIFRLAGEGYDAPTPVCEALLQLWNFGWAMGVWLMLCQALPVVGRTIIQRYAGYSQAGVYASLYELAVRSFSFFAFPITQAAHPRIMRYWNHGDRGNARVMVRRAIQAQALMFLPIEAVAIAFGRPLTALIVGPNQGTSSSLLPMLMLGGFLWQIALLVHKPLEVMRRTTTMLSAMVSVFLIELAGNYLLVPHFGINGVVSVFVLGAVVYLAIVAACGGLPEDRGHSDRLHEDGSGLELAGNRL
jgi:O-antigen/teichoic acid export membrane protein